MLIRLCRWLCRLGMVFLSFLSPQLFLFLCFCFPLASSLLSYCHVLIFHLLHYSFVVSLLSHVTFQTWNLKCFTQTCSFGDSSPCWLICPIYKKLWFLVSLCLACLISHGHPTHGLIICSYYLFFINNCILFHCCFPFLVFVL